MRRQKNFVFMVSNTVLCFFVVIGFTLLAPIGSDALPIEQLKLPPGFQISVYSAQVPGARSMALSPKGVLFVGTKEMHGPVYALEDLNHDGKADVVHKVASGLFMPNGVAFREGSLYVAEVNRVIRFDGIEDALENPPRPVIVNNSLPDKTHHGWKYIRFGPDDLLYIPVGAPCNACVQDDPRFASLMRMKPDGSNLEIYAKGIRNTVGFDWDPATKDVWFTDNGRDLLGDDLPPDELNHAPHKGMNFGFPFRYGMNMPDPEFGAKDKTTEFTPPAQPLGPHVASLGMRFYTGKMFPAIYQNQVFICEHGSWNRSNKIGYRISLVTLKDGKPVEYKPFITGWLQPGDKVWGRPVDLCLMPDGSMLVSDDHAGAIYRITYQGEK